MQKSSVADGYPRSWIPDPVFSHPGSPIQQQQKFYKIVNAKKSKMVTKLSEIWVGSGIRKTYPWSEFRAKKSNGFWSATLQKSLLYTETFSITRHRKCLSIFFRWTFFQVLGNQNFEPRIYFVLVIVLKKVFFVVYFE